MNYGKMEVEEAGKREAQAWRPIETAPNDKQVLIVTNLGNMFTAISMETKQGDWVWVSLMAADSIAIIGGTITHWMPLPEPPKGG